MKNNPVYLIIECCKMDNFIDYWGETAPDYENVIGVYTDPNEAESVRAKLQTADDEYVKNCDTDPVEYIIREFRIGELGA